MTGGSVLPAPLGADFYDTQTLVLEVPLEHMQGVCKLEDDQQRGFRGDSAEIKS